MVSTPLITNGFKLSIIALFASYCIIIKILFSDNQSKQTTIYRWVRFNKYCGVENHDKCLNEFKLLFSLKKNVTGVFCHSHFNHTLRLAKEGYLNTKSIHLKDVENINLSCKGFSILLSSLAVNLQLLQVSFSHYSEVT